MTKRTCEPKTTYIRTMASQNLSVRTCIGEILDNALDAGAGTVDLIFGKMNGKRYFSVRDNGGGAPDINALVVLGDHRDHPGTKLGRHGVGAKDATLWIGGPDSTLRVTSVHAGRTSALAVDWADMQTNGRWEYDEPDVRDASPGERGTHITILNCWRGPPHGEEWRRLVTDLEYMYAPALRTAQITMATGGQKPSPLVRWEPPPLEPGHIDCVLDVNGKKARLFIGIIKPGHGTARRGITYFHGWRVIEPASGKGCGEYEASAAHVCGFVEVDRSWGLTKNKDAILGSDHLYAAVAAAAKPILEKAHQRATLVTSELFTTAIESALNANLATANAKAKRGKGNKHGTARPTGKGSGHRRAAVEQLGDTFVGRDGRGSGGIKVAHASLGSVTQIGIFQRPSLVTLNTDNAGVMASQTNNNVLASMTAAAALIAIEEALSGQKVLKGIGSEDTDPINRFQHAMGALLGSATTRVDGTQIVAMQNPKKQFAVTPEPELATQ